MIDVAIPVQSNIRKNVYNETENYQELKEQLEQMWGVKCGPMDNGSSRS